MASGIPTTWASALALAFGVIFTRYRPDSSLISRTSSLVALSAMVPRVTWSLAERVCTVPSLASLLAISTTPSDSTQVMMVPDA
ncbi:Uncharacterised protein [Mycobacterium tuberculosis]|nr:Uncharacterised protein [Mycobacterium tuberculosis]